MNNQQAALMAAATIVAQHYGSTQAVESTRQYAEQFLEWLDRQDAERGGTMQEPGVPIRERELAETGTFDTVVTGRILSRWTDERGVGWADVEPVAQTGGSVTRDGR